MMCSELPWPHQSAVQRPGTGTNNNQGDRDARRKQVIFESLAFLVAVPVHKETVWPNCNDSHEHHARDAEGRNARQEPDREAKRTEELGGNRQHTKPLGNSRVREVLHGSAKAMAAKPAEHLLSAVRKHHYCKGD